MTDDTQSDSIDSTAPTDSATATGETYGLVVVHRGEAAVGRLVDGRVRTDATFDEPITGGARAGRGGTGCFERDRAAETRAFFERVGDAAARTFRDADIEGIAVGGTLDTTERFLDGGYPGADLTEQVVGTYTVEHGSASALPDLVAAASEDLFDGAARTVRAVLDEFFRRLRDDDRVVYGHEDLDRAVAEGRVATALVSSAVDAERQAAIERVVAEQGGETLVVPRERDRGGQFAAAFEVGALLREPGADSTTRPD